MPRQLSIFLSTLLIFGMIQLGCQVRAQSPKTITNSIGMKLVLIPKGTFQMGSPIEEAGADDDEAQHQVTISKDYYLGVTEVTQGQYEKVMGTNPSYFQKRVIRKSDSSMYPVEQVSWEDAVEFCKKLSDLPEEQAAGRVYRLPTEAEWEYACRAGSKTAYSFGDNGRDLGNHAWFGNNSGSKELDSAALWARLKDNPKEYLDTLLSAGCATHPVGEKKANAWGLYDMHGNVWEWCSDWYGDYPTDWVTNPSGPRKGSDRVLRGGSWFFVAAYCRSAFRRRDFPSNRNNNNGFRVALNSNGRKSWMASGGCPGIPDGTVRFPVWPGFGLVSKTSTRDRVVLVGRLDDRCESSIRSFLLRKQLLGSRHRSNSRSTYFESYPLYWRGSVSGGDLQNPSVLATHRDSKNDSIWDARREIQRRTTPCTKLHGRYRKPKQLARNAKNPRKTSGFAAQASES